MKTSEALRQTIETTTKLAETVARLGDSVRLLHKRIDELEDPEIDLDGGGPEVGTPESVADATEQRSAPPVTVQAEPEVSMVIGDSSEEQKAAYRAFVAEKERLEQQRRGLVEEGDQRVIAPPTQAQKLLRIQLAKEIGWEHWTRSEEYGSDPLPPATAAIAYVKGGPVWLVNYDRDFVLEQTMATRQRMVEDVMLTDVEAANELSADILKHKDVNDPSVATDNAEAAWDA